jgi:hypothetical protein
MANGLDPNLAIHPAAMVRSPHRLSLHLSGLRLRRILFPNGCEGPGADRPHRGLPGTVAAGCGGRERPPKATVLQHSTPISKAI